MNLFRPQGKHKRTIILYSLAMILPGIILSVMAFRGILGNMAMTEKTQSQKLVNISQNFYDDLEESISKSIQKLLSDEFYPETGFIDFIDPIERNEFLKDGRFLSIITWLPDSGVTILNNSLLFVPDRYWDGPHQTKLSISLHSLCMEEEFEKQNLYQALKISKQVFKESSSIMLKTQALMSQARMQRKLNQNREIKKLYRDIFELSKDPEILSLQDSIPRILMGDVITSWFQKNEFSSDTKDLSIPTIEILAFLAIPQIHLTQVNYRLCMEECNSLLGILMESPSESIIDLELIESLLAKREGLIHQHDVIIRNSDQIIRTIKNVDINNADIHQSGFPYYEDSVSLYTAFSAGPGGGRMALTINIRKFLEENSIRFFMAKRYQENIRWQIKDEREDIIISDPNFDSKGANVSDSPISLGLWSLHLQYEKPNWVRQAFSSSQGKYLAGILFVILGLAVGLTFTLRGLAQENRLTKLKSDFISSVSHELKSPVTSIRQMSELLNRDRIQSEERKKEYYSTMVAQSERLSHLVENILDFSRLEYGQKKLKLEPVRIDQILKDVIGIFEIRLRYTGYNLRSSIPDKVPIVFIDQEGLQQVFYNLLDNAYKYSGKSKDIDVSLNLLEKGIKVSFQDYGIGIHPKDQRKIFERYYRSSHDITKGIKGNGIGLAIVMQVVKAHNGTLDVKSQLGKGSTFTVFIPFSKTSKS